jgi:hypothetical protein
VAQRLAAFCLTYVEDLPRLATQLVALNPDVIFAPADTLSDFKPRSS